MNPIYSALENIAAINSSIAQQRGLLQTAHAGIKQQIQKALKEMHQVFEGLPILDEYQTEVSAYDHLVRVHPEGDALHACFQFMFRNELNEFDLVVPLRYLASNGREVMEQDAAEMRAKKLAQEESDAAVQEARDRRELARLSEKFGSASA